MRGFPEVTHIELSAHSLKWSNCVTVTMITSFQSCSHPTVVGCCDPDFPGPGKETGPPHAARRGLGRGRRRRAALSGQGNMLGQRCVQRHTPYMVGWDLNPGPATPVPEASTLHLATFWLFTQKYVKRQARVSSTLNFPLSPTLWR